MNSTLLNAINKVHCTYLKTRKEKNRVFCQNTGIFEKTINGTYKNWKSTIKKQNTELKNGLGDT